MANIKITTWQMKAKFGDTDAMNNLGIAYRDGLGIEKNSDGIYYINRDIIPTQLVITSELSEKEKGVFLCEILQKCAPFLRFYSSMEAQYASVVFLNFARKTKEIISETISRMIAMGGTQRKRTASIIKAITAFQSFSSFSTISSTLRSKPTIWSSSMIL